MNKAAVVTILRTQDTLGWQEDRGGICMYEHAFRGSAVLRDPVVMEGRCYTNMFAIYYKYNRKMWESKLACIIEHTEC